MSRCPGLSFPRTARRSSAKVEVLIAGIGNVLRGDDGFGPAVVQALLNPLRAITHPLHVHALELGLGGINLVRELMDGYDALVLVDIVDRDGAPGTLYVLEPQIPDVATVPAAQRHRLSDLHQANPGNALVLARAAGVLPRSIRIIGCQPEQTENFSTELSPVVQEAVPAAVEAILTFLGTLDEAPSHVEA